MRCALSATVPFSDKIRTKWLRNHLELEEVPCLHLISPSEGGAIVTKDGEGAVLGDPDGLGYPWKSRLVRDLKYDPGELHRGPCLVLFLEAASPEQRNSYNKELTLCSKQGGMTSAFSLFVVSEVCGMSSQLRNSMGMQCATAQSKIDAVIVDLSWHEGPSYFVCENAVPSRASEIGPFVSRTAALFLAEELEPRPLMDVWHLLKARALTRAQPHCATTGQLYFQPHPGCQ